MIHFFWNYRLTLRNVLPFGTAALHKNDEQKKWLLKEYDDDDDVLSFYVMFFLMNYFFFVGSVRVFRQKFLLCSGFWHI